MKVLDTNFLIEFMANKRKAVEKMQSIKNDILLVSESSVIELYAGAKNARAPAQEVSKIQEVLSRLNVIEVNAEVRERIADVYAYLSKSRKMIDKYDITIAGTALTMNSTLVTEDGHFDRIEECLGLKVEGWHDLQ